MGTANRVIMSTPAMTSSMVIQLRNYVALVLKFQEVKGSRIDMSTRYYVCVCVCLFIYDSFFRGP